MNEHYLVIQRGRLLRGWGEYGVREGMGVVNHLGAASPFLVFLASSLCMHSGRESSIIFVPCMTVSFQSDAFVLNIEQCSCYILLSDVHNNRHYHLQISRSQVLNESTECFIFRIVKPSRKKVWIFHEQFASFTFLCFNIYKIDPKAIKMLSIKEAKGGKIFIFCLAQFGTEMRRHQLNHSVCICI